MSISRYKSKGWYGESQRHSLASRGFKTYRKVYKKYPEHYWDSIRITKETMQTDSRLINLQERAKELGHHVHMTTLDRWFAHHYAKEMAKIDAELKQNIHPIERQELLDKRKKLERIRHKFGQGYFNWHELKENMSYLAPISIGTILMSAVGSAEISQSFVVGAGLTTVGIITILSNEYQQALNSVEWQLKRQRRQALFKGDMKEASRIKAKISDLHREGREEVFSGYRSANQKQTVA